MPKGITFLWKDISLDCFLALHKQQEPEMVLLLFFSHSSLTLKLSKNFKSFIKAPTPYFNFWSQRDLYFLIVEIKRCQWPDLTTVTDGRMTQFRLLILGAGQRPLNLNLKCHSWRKHLLHRIGDEGVCSVSKEPSERGMLTRNTRRARVLFFFDPATPIRASTSAFRSFKMPTQSTLQIQTVTEQFQDHT